jgi:hypothetical protein
MNMRDYVQLRAAQEGAEMMREAIAIEIANCVVDDKPISKKLKYAFMESRMAVESTTRDIHNCITNEAMIQSFGEENP